MHNKRSVKYLAEFTTLCNLSVEMEFLGATLGNIISYFDTFTGLWAHAAHSNDFIGQGRSQCANQGSDKVERYRNTSCAG